MVMSIGVDYAAGNWKACLLENGQTIELCAFADSTAMLAYLEHTCALNPEPIIALSSALDTTFVPSNSVTDQQLGEVSRYYNQGDQTSDVNNFLKAMKSINLSSCCLPGIKQLPSVPAHRKLNRLAMGAADKLCTVALLLYRLCEREAAWPEMNFFCLEVQEGSMNIIVVQEGQIVNGISGMAGISEVRLHLRTDGSLSFSYGPEHQEYTYRSGWLDLMESAEDEVSNGRARERAFWEGLEQELAGLMAIHHFEDIVVMGQHKDTVIEWFGDMYQLYHFPYKESDLQGFEAAIGAAIIAEGLAHAGLAAEVVDRLQIRGSISYDVNALTLPEMRVPSPQLPR